MDQTQFSPNTTFSASNVALPVGTVSEQPVVLSRDTEIQVLRTVLTKYKDGLDDGGQLAAFIIENPDASIKAVETYDRQQAKVIDALDKFLLGDRSDTTKLERAMDTLFALRGNNSTPSVRRVGQGRKRSRYDQH